MKERIRILTTKDKEKDFLFAKGGSLISEEDTVILGKTRKAFLFELPLDSMRGTTLVPPKVEILFGTDFPLGETRDGEFIKKISCGRFFRDDEGKLRFSAEDNSEKVSKIIYEALALRPLTKEEEKEKERKEKEEERKRQELEMKRWRKELEIYLEGLKREVQRVESALRENTHKALLLAFHRPRMEWPSEEDNDC